MNTSIDRTEVISENKAREFLKQKQNVVNKQNQKFIEIRRRIESLKDKKSLRDELEFFL